MPRLRAADLPGGTDATLGRIAKEGPAMIVIEQQPKRVEVTVYAEFTLADYQEFETAVNYAIQFEGTGRPVF
jgi:hypothetical protein